MSVEVKVDEFTQLFLSWVDSPHVKEFNALLDVIFNHVSGIKRGKIISHEEVLIKLNDFLNASRKKSIESELEPDIVEDIWRWLTMLGTHGEKHHQSWARLLYGLQKQCEHNSQIFKAFLELSPFNDNSMICIRIVTDEFGNCYREGHNRLNDLCDRLGYTKDEPSICLLLITDQALASMRLVRVN